MRVTVCELSNDSKQFEEDWKQLVSHCQLNKSELVLLPEMPFHPWIAGRPLVDNALQNKAIQAHEKLFRLGHASRNRRRINAPLVRPSGVL